MLLLALGSLLIQKQYHYPDEELVEQIRENPYYQYFIGLPGYEDKIPFAFAYSVYCNRQLLAVYSDICYDISSGSRYFPHGRRQKYGSRYARMPQVLSRSKNVASARLVL